jgi:heme exporter protein C
MNIHKIRLTYKTIAVVFLSYALIAGLASKLPDIGGNIQQTSRNLFYHVPMWFTMYLMMAFSVWYSIRFLQHGKSTFDLQAKESGIIGVLFGLMGLLTGIVWSRVTWGEAMPDHNPGAWWVWDPKQTGALIAVLAYIAYFLLRASIENANRRARVAAVYNIFAAAMLVPLTLIIPRILGGLHPGAEGGPVFNASDISAQYRIVFYPAIIGFMCLALWLLELRVRMAKLAAQLTATN